MPTMKEDLEAIAAAREAFLKAGWSYLDAIAYLQARCDRYREALDRITCQPKSYGADMLEIALEALKR